MKIYPEYEDWAMHMLTRNRPSPEDWRGMTINEACRRAETICAIADESPGQGLRLINAYDCLKKMVKVMTERYPPR